MARRVFLTTIMSILIVALVLPVTVAATGPGRADDRPGTGEGMPAFVQEKMQARWVSRFGDIEEAPWASSFIEMMRSKGVVNGRKPDQFDPKGNVTRAEALTMIVRTLGLEEEAGALAEEGAELPEQFIDVPEWARGYVALALERGIVSPEGGYSLGADASRVEIAQMLVNLMGLGEDMDGLDDVELPFDDDVSEQHRAQVAVAYALGIIKGNGNNEFEPLRNVMRAEIAIMLGRVMREMPRQGDENYIKGILADITGDEDGRVTLVIQYRGGELQVPVAEGATVFLDDNQATLADLVSGYHLEIILDDAGAAEWIAAFSEEMEEDDQEVAGTVVGVSTPSEESNGSITVTTAEGDATYQLAGGVVVKMQGEAATLADIVVGDEVELKLVSDIVIRIVIDEREEEEVEAAIVSINSAAEGALASITVSILGADEGDEGDDGAGLLVTYELNSDVVLLLAGQEVDLTALQVGDVIEIKLIGGVVVKVVIEVPAGSDDEDEENQDQDEEQGDDTGTATIIGVVSSVTTSTDGSYTIAVTTGEGTEESYSVAQDVAVTKDEIQVTLEDVENGDTVELTIDEDGIVTAIDITQ